MAKDDDMFMDIDSWPDAPTYHGPPIRRIKPSGKPITKSAFEGHPHRNCKAFHPDDCICSQHQRYYLPYDEDKALATLYRKWGQNHRGYYPDKPYHSVDPNSIPEFTEDLTVEDLAKPIREVRAVSTHKPMPKKKARDMEVFED